MPIYAYACKSCEHQLEALQKISEAPLVECPECGEPALKRLLSAPRFRLKGSGWYETDFKKDNQRNLAASDSEKPKSEDKPGDKAGDKQAGDKAAVAKTADAKPAKKAASKEG